MYRQSVLCWGLTCVLSVSGFAGITQDQGFEVGGETLAILTEGIGTAGDGSHAVISLGQTAIPACGLFAMQNDSVVFSQKGSVAGVCGGLGVLQNGGAVGGQSQKLDSCYGPGVQGQGIDLGLTQAVTDLYGGGTALASQRVVADRVQVAGAVCGLMTTDQLVKASQDASVHGIPGSSGGIVANIVCTATQGQSID
jgi:hypothetical protein